ncbi:MAG TPA: DNA primase [Mycobacteriales bacterium]|nr:DNA primase [Mycobacteriales bacterium]
MAGRIRDEDVRTVRERSPIAEVIGQHLQLRAAGGGSLKGLCPFHDEKSPSFNVSPERGLFHCFGCGEGGDVIRFVERVEHLSFVEAVESLARRAGIALEYEQGSAAPGRQSGQRQRLLDVHAAAGAFYAEQLATPAAAAGRAFLTDRGFDLDTAARFGVGYAPAGWDALIGQLRGEGFTEEELLTAGVARRSARGSAIDAFRDRLVWPIRDIKGDVIGFGARRLSADDPVQAKYLNTSETPLFKKSQVLYGLDLAKADIARSMQAVVVEGYTDVMACHLAGVKTAVATCGTAFGTEHIAILRRLLMDQDEFRGRVIFTFDGDAAGQKAALRAFEEDQRFVTQTFVAVEPSGADPCELRMAKGDAAVRDLIASHVPLFEFAIRSTLARYDLELVEDRVAALAAAAPLVARMKDRALRPEYARRLAGWLGLDVELVLRRVGELAGGGKRATSGPPVPDRSDPRLVVQREAVKLAVQRPALAGPLFDDLDGDAFSHPAYAAVRATVAAAGGAATSAGGPEWVGRLRELAPEDTVRALVTELAVEPMRSDEDGMPRYAASLVAKLREIAVSRRLNEIRSRLQRVNPIEEPEQHKKLFGELIALEAHRRALLEQGIGEL